MKIFPLSTAQIQIPKGRQRKEFKPEEIVSLASSIESARLIHPITVRWSEEDKSYYLVAGERRLKAIEWLWALGQKLVFAQETFEEGFVPCVDQGTLTPLEAYEMELAENIERVDLNWQDKAQATSQFLELKRLQAEKAGAPEPTHLDIAVELRPEITRPVALDTARKEVILSKLLQDKDISSAPSLDAAFKIAKRKEELRRSAQLGESVGKTFAAVDHQLINGDCLNYLRECNDGKFDVILSDPIYGMGADGFGDSGGKANGEHFYSDSYENWLELMLEICPHLARVTKPAAHCYLFCDFDRFHQLKGMMTGAGWDVFRTPIIWINPTSNRAPWPEQGPMRKWQMILYAVKGKKLCNSLAPDFLVFPSDPNLNHQAQKPVSLFKQLLARSCKPGDKVLDFMCGTGPIFPAAHELKVYATGLEIDPAAYGIAVKRLGELK